ncbi:MAG: hypothetical protein ACM31E_07100 [Fibrobacterota bacterium]
MLIFPMPCLTVLLKMAPPSVSIFIFGAGYKTTVRINGREPITSNEGSTSSQIPGGLKKGTNAIEIYVVKQAGKMDMYPSIEVKYIDKTKQEIGVRRFRWNRNVHMKIGSLSAFIFPVCYV